MVDSVKQYNLAGVAANVELGKQGSIIVGSDAGAISFTDKNGDLIVAEIAEGTDPTHAVSFSQFSASSGQKLQYVKTSVGYNDGNVSLGTADANTYIHSVTISPNNTWLNTDSNTDITVGDSTNPARLFAAFDPGMQTSDETDHEYSTSTTIVAYVTPGAATAGTSDVIVWYSGKIS